MKDTEIKINEVTVDGMVYGAPQFSHSVLGEKFYAVQLAVMRKSGVMDYIPVTVSDRGFNIGDIKEGVEMSVTGTFRSHNKYTDGRCRLFLSVFASTILIPGLQTDKNKIFLQGTICKKPTYRMTPLGREITELFLAVNRDYGKSDYIPCIAWGRNAIYANTLSVGTKVNCRGRVQSRTYIKNNEEHIVNEVSLYSIDLAEQRRNTKEEIQDEN